LFKLKRRANCTFQTWEECRLAPLSCP